MRSLRKSEHLTDDGVSAVLQECRALLEKNHFSEDEIDLYLERVADVLGFYRENLGEGANIE